MTICILGKAPPATKQETACIPTQTTSGWPLAEQIFAYDKKKELNFKSEYLYTLNIFFYAESEKENQF